MVASAADDGVAPAVAQASAKLLASPEVVEELEADYAKSGYCLAAGLLGEDEGKIHRVGPKFGPTSGL